MFASFAQSKVDGILKRINSFGGERGTGELKGRERKDAEKERNLLALFVRE